MSEFRDRSVDKELMELALTENRILLTEDKDFGWLVFAGRTESPGVILIRFPASSRKLLAAAVCETGARTRLTTGRRLRSSAARRGPHQFRTSERAMKRRAGRRIIHEAHHSGPVFRGERQYVAECLDLPVVTDASTLGVSCSCTAEGMSTW